MSIISTPDPGAGQEEITWQRGGEAGRWENDPRSAVEVRGDHEGSESRTIRERHMKMQRGSERSRVSHCRLETDVVASCIRQVEKAWRQTGASLERNADLLTPWRQLSKRELPTDNNDVACC